MTEGNIASWKVQEGDEFSAGDVLLEIETDKASMDVEAQDDGIMAKITQGDGTKGIKVGTRIGVLAEAGDDISSLEMPAEDSAAAPSPKEEASKPKPETPSESQALTSKPSPSSSADATAERSSKPSKKQTYPLLPSVEALIHQKGLSQDDLGKMTPSGPNNRLLKGDVLAYLGTISESYPTELSAKIARLSHLDLSHITLAKPPPKPEKKAEAVPGPVLEKPSQVAVPVSMRSVIEVQERVQRTLGVFVPLSTFIARASDVANGNLPRSKTYTPSADELFNQVLGLDNTSSTAGARGTFFPQITPPPTSAPTIQSVKAPVKRADIVDILSGTTKRTTPVLAAKTAPGMSSSVNVFSVEVPKGDEKRAQVFLDRVKTVLEGEPGSLVL
ncbi:putative pyruvate dehydrogenase complex protein X component, mitochondrial [Amylocarpus encephaloides]|uniref:Pyruvate dehydrogenase complex protein X component, mitochondrial n=1 Tax=Amylocarpus encephaloides TaxID=45428 RepID=A0A9P7YQL6_9HELO|nr:putative pyruvate dehydrogenase complex protein X component, mitochondrial [Amylocarpus encephaloides]